MHTKDFSSAPSAARGQFVFFGGTRYAGIRALLQLSWVWFQLARAMRRAPGYMGHHLWYRFPYTFGNFSVWDSWDHMMEFGRSREHRKVMKWVARPSIGRASFVRFLRASPEGHTLGKWRAEPDPDKEWRRYQLPFSSRRVDVTEDWWEA